MRHQALDFLDECGDFRSFRLLALHFFVAHQQQSHLIAATGIDLAHPLPGLIGLPRRKSTRSYIIHHHPGEQTEQVVIHPPAVAALFKEGGIRISGGIGQEFGLCHRSQQAVAVMLQLSVGRKPKGTFHRTVFASHGLKDTMLHHLGTVGCQVTGYNAFRHKCTQQLGIVRGGHGLLADGMEHFDGRSRKIAVIGLVKLCP